MRKSNGTPLADWFIEHGERDACTGFVHVEDEFKPMPFYHKWFVYWWARLLMAGMFKVVWRSMCDRAKYLWRKFHA